MIANTSFGVDAISYTVITAIGDVKIVNSAGSAPARIHQALSTGDTIVTGKQSLMDLAIGKQGIMRVQENSRISVASLVKSGDEPNIDMSSGNVLVILSKLIKSDSYEVKTRTQVASVRGTIFQVSGSENESQVDVFSGQVSVNPVLNGAIQRQIAELVSQGQSASLSKLLVLDILAKKKKVTLKAIRGEMKEAFLKQALLIRSNPEYKQIAAEARKEIDDRIKQIKKELEEKKEEQKSMIQKMKQDQTREKKK